MIPRRPGLAFAAALLVGAASAGAHDGPPYPIVVDRPTGPVLLSAWADPDVGIGTFHVYLEPLGGKPLPEGGRVRIHVRPSSGRLPEAAHDATPFRMERERQHFVAEIPFDAPERWSVRIEVASAGGGGQTDVTVDVTPPGQGPLLDFVLYGLPFAVAGFFVVRALIVSRRRPKPTEPPAA